MIINNYYASNANQNLSYFTSIIGPIISGLLLALAYYLQNIWNMKKEITIRKNEVYGRIRALMHTIQNEYFLKMSAEAHYKFYMFRSQLIKYKEDVKDANQFYNISVTMTEKLVNFEKEIIECLAVVAALTGNKILKYEDYINRISKLKPLAIKEIPENVNGISELDIWLNKTEQEIWKHIDDNFGQLFNEINSSMIEDLGYSNRPGFLKFRIFILRVKSKFSQIL